MTHNEKSEEYSLTYSIDNAILMHRDVHFGGNFELMLDYYKNEGRGTAKEFDIARIEQLNQMQIESGSDLAPLMLSGPEIEKIARARQVYQQLKALYEVKNQKNRIPTLIADLILAEEEDVPAALGAAAAEKSAIVPALIDLLRNDEFYDPLYPGYGQAPDLAAQCLGMIGDKRAIISLFEQIGKGDFFVEDTILKALQAIGAPAKTFLLHVMHAQPITSDNENAAVALIAFKDDPEVTTACLKMLQTIDLNKNSLFATYLVLACEGLTSISQRKELLHLAEQSTTPKTIILDIKAIAQKWV